ncbi:MAG: DNA polymerase III subunit delta, partial [Oscillospiraceae bacterium]|nr:DNA polymerase III subunit delta [Oscillospiraceae bacterium]
LSKENFALFEEGIRQIPETSVLIFYMDLTEVSTKKTDKWFPILTLCAKQGICAELNGRSVGAMVSLIASGAKKRGCTISPETAQYLIRYCGDELQVLLNELDKLCAFVGSGGITEENINEVCVKSVEASVFDLAKTIIENNADAAFSILTALLSQKTEPTIILGTLASTYVDIYRAKAAAAENRHTREITNLFSYKGKSFRLEQASKLARSLSLQTAKQCVAALSEADIAIKFSSKPNSLVLEELLTKLLQV